MVTPIDYADVCVNVDHMWFEKSDLPIPVSIDVLTLPEYKNLLVVEDPASSSPGLAFLLAAYTRLGDGSEAWWQALKNNGVKVAASWSDAYFNDFTAGGGSGKYPLVVSYATSPVAEYVYAADPKPTAVSTTVITEGCFRQIEYAGVLRGTQHPAEARKVIDWLLSDGFQSEVATNMFVFPAITNGVIPPEFTKFSGVVSNPGVLPTSKIESLIPTLLEQWNRVMAS
jgi:thiamine transport system substrate-binding protein